MEPTAKQLDRTAPAELTDPPSTYRVSGVEMALIFNGNYNKHHRLRRKRNLRYVTVADMRREIQDMREDAAVLIQKAHEAEAALGMYVGLRGAIGHPRTFCEDFRVALDGIDWTKENVAL